MDEKVPSPAEALAEIQRTQRAAYARQRLPLWYVPAFLGAITLVGIGTELHGTARGAVFIGNSVLIGSPVSPWSSRGAGADGICRLLVQYLLISSVPCSTFRPARPDTRRGAALLVLMGAVTGGAVPVFQGSA